MVQDAQYGYGQAGSFSFPSVPPSSALTYEVEMVEWEDPDEEDEQVGVREGWLQGLGLFRVHGGMREGGDRAGDA